MSVPEILRWDQAYNRSGDGKLPRAVVNVIRTYMDNDSLTGWVSLETLTADTGLSRSQVQRQIKANTEAGWLEIVKPGYGNRAPVYRLTYRESRISAPIQPDEDKQESRIYARISGANDENDAYMRQESRIYDTPTSPRTSPQEKFSSEPATADNPWATEPTWRAEVIAREERAQEMEPATAGVPTDSPWD